MTSPTLELQGAIVPLLKADATLSAIIGGRVYDHVPRSGTTGAVTAEFPFIGMGFWGETQDDADCIDGSEIFGRIECWSRSVGKAEVQRLAAAVKSALRRANIELSDNALTLLEWVRTDTNADPDGLTSHATVEIRALVETPQTSP